MHRSFFSLQYLIHHHTIKAVSIPSLDTPRGTDLNMSEKPPIKKRTAKVRKPASPPANNPLADIVFLKTREGIIETDANSIILSVNPAFTTITGYSPEDAIGRKISILHSERHPAAFYTEMWQTIARKGSWQGDIWDRRKNGEIYPSSLSITALTDEKSLVKRYVGIINDFAGNSIDFREKAHYDHLTGLPNRSLLDDQLNFMIAHARRNGQIMAVLFIDLDRFKTANDTLGYAIGDLLLQGVAKRLKKAVREVDAVFRLGNDEFAIILEEIAHIQDAAKVAQKLLALFTQPFIFEGCKHEVYINASIGISLFPYDGVNMETLVKNAETAMLRAKDQGQNQHQHYTPGMNARAFEHLTIEFQMHKALKNQEFIVYYQPLIDLANHSILGAEALVRWQHPDMGLVAPDEFIPIAEETGLIVPIGEMVLRSACGQTKAWHAMGLGPLRISVNLSARQFQQRNLVGTIAEAISDAGLKPEFVDLEITESFGMKNPELTVKILRELRKRGMHISIDDFGTGYSSLNYLKRFPLTALKIDRSFVRDIFIDPDDSAIVKIMITMAHTLNLKVVAEGVENEKQLEFLRAAGCDYCQGYFFSPPVAPDKFEKYAREFRLP
jgi:diguanylate cyclase (GGDEF)-like protein/PAS domain S-box-containing protein